MCGNVRLPLTIPKASQSLDSRSKSISGFLCQWNAHYIAAANLSNPSLDSTFLLSQLFTWSSRPHFLPSFLLPPQHAERREKDPCRRQPHLLLINHSVSSYLQVHMYNYTVNISDEKVREIIFKSAIRVSVYGSGRRRWIICYCFN